MSNEYKDWERDKIEEEKILVKEYPFLRARNIDGTLSNSKFPMIELEIPKGWEELFFQMCADIKLILQKYNMLDKFYFRQVKEKYNSLRCYGSFSLEEIDLILQKYEVISTYICTNCGAPATIETKNYIASFCGGCWKDNFRNEKVESINFKDYYRFVRYNKKEEKKIDVEISFKEEWERYLKNRGKINE